MALDLQQRATQHGHRRHNPRHETENSRLNSTAGPHQKWGDYRFNGSIIIAIAFSTHRYFEAVLAQYLLIIVRTIMAPTIRVVDAVLRR
jgi:hypothetical protein